MSNPNTVLVTEDTFTRHYQLDVNDLYEYPASRTVKALATCADASEIRVIKAPKSSGGHFTFDTNIGDKQFLSTVFKTNYRIPLIVTPTTWPKTTDATPVDVVVTDENFLEVIFNNNNDICLAQHGIAQAEVFNAISLNSKSMNPVTQTPAMTSIISPYWQVDDTNEYIQASQPDRFQSFEAYDGAAAQSLKFLNEHCTPAVTTISPMNEQNIFTSKYQRGYSTRTPQWEFVSSTPGVSIKVMCTFWTYTNFNIGSTPNNESSLSGINRFGLTTRLANDVGAKIFSIKKTGGVSRYSNIVLDVADSEKLEAWLTLRITSAPQFMHTQSYDEKTGLMKPYSVGYPRVDCLEFNSVTVKAGAMQAFNQDSIQLGSLPRSVYIALLKHRGDSFTEVTQTPINFGLINNLNVSINSKITSFPDQLSLDYVTNSNGYDEMDPLGKLIKGYPIKLNFGKDITTSSNVVVGAGGPFNFTVSGNFYNQGETTSTYRLYTIFVYDDTLDFNGTSFSQSSGVYVPSSLLSSDYFLRDLFHNQQKEINTLGAGRFGDAIKWVSRNAVKLAKNAWDNRDKIASTVGDVMSLVKQVRGGKLAQSNVSGAGAVGTITLGAGSVRKTVFK